MLDKDDLLEMYTTRMAMSVYAKQIAIDFFNWQKKDYAECCADMSAEEWFDKYLKSKK